MLLQTLATAASRRALLASLPIESGWQIADVGCGFGASTVELAALRPVSVVGVDSDRQVLAVASAVAARLGESPGTGSGVGFAAGDAYQLPFACGGLDAVFSRFVFQHLADPAAAATELARVLRPDGLACVVDVDDGLSITEPPPSAAFTRLAGALRAAQHGYGGDRHVGRRLAGLLDSAGLEPAAVLVLPQAAYHRPGPADPARRLLVERLEAARSGIIEGGHMSRAEFESALAEVAAEDRGPTCEVEAHLAVVARRRREAGQAGSANVGERQASID